ncbi:MAG TPA: HlyD family efflux transporter periplasmic adaptor subunit [Acidimicrobiales bacterium]|nr:HlyD family efflux transporter periplasmic adaptor subunit [Acidimicrobiales bacterium]
MATPTDEVAEQERRESSQTRRRLAPDAPRQAGVERFDDAILVTRTRAWLGLVACLALVVGVIVWATTTRVDTTVKGSGISLVNGAITSVDSPVDGTIKSVDVAVGDQVAPSQAVVTVEATGGGVATVVAPIKGRVLNLPDGQGATIHSGDAVVALAQTSGPLQVRMFIPPAKAQQVEVGTTAILAYPQGVTVKGRVTQIGQVPLTLHQISDSIGSPAIAALIASGDGLIPVWVTPSVPAAESGVANNGDVAAVTLIVGTKHPINYVF